MKVTEVSQLIDQLVFEHTGKHLDDVQKAIIEGTWQGQTYEDIGKECNRSKNHVRDVGYQLWQLLSEALGEEIKKSNFRSNVERLYIKSSQVVEINHNFNFCSQIFNQLNKNNRNSDINTQAKSLYHDLTLAPQLIYFYNRETELEKLSNWIFKQNTRLISVLGLSGIGKTTLVKRFIDLNLQQFEVIIWRKLKFSKSLDVLIDDFLNIDQEKIQENTDYNLKKLLNFLQKKSV